MMRSLLSLWLLLAALPPLSLYADAADPHLLDWSSPQGVKRLSESAYKTDFFALAVSFQAQPNGVVCGPTTGAIVLNALRQQRREDRIPMADIDRDDTRYMPAGADPRVKRYTPDNFLGTLTDPIKTREEIFGRPIDGKPDYGLQLRQLHRMFLAHGAASALQVVNDELTLDEMRRDLRANLQAGGDYVVINYARKALGQDGPGHISPVGAYHAGSDSFLIMDVTSYDHDWVWVSAERLYQAMKTHDTRENRGYLLISDES